MSDYFLLTKRLKFSVWKEEDLPLAQLLWGDPEVTRFLSADGKFSEQQIAERLALEISQQENFHWQYWPVFERSSGELTGCCGLRPLLPSSDNVRESGNSDTAEFGIHLREKFWGMGYGEEAGRAIIRYAYDVLKVQSIVAGHHPENSASEKLLNKLGFRFVGTEFYPPTGLFHSAYCHVRDVSGQ